MPNVNTSPDDLIQPFLIEASGLRGCLIRMGPTLSDIIGRHDLPPAVQSLTAEFAASRDLSAALKFDGVFFLQAKGDGPVGLMAADVTSDGGIRAYASVSDDVPSLGRSKVRQSHAFWVRVT